jgi:RNA polymerase sigma factor (sigma-70 family)
MDELVALCENHIRAEVRRHLSARARELFDSSDFTQDTCIIFFKNGLYKQPFESVKHLRSFLCGVARHAVWDRLRRYNIEWARTVPLDEESPEQASLLCNAGADPVLQAIARDEWLALLRGLDVATRFVLTRRRKGMPHDEIAALLGVNVRTVQRLIRRGLWALAKLG